MLRGTGGEVLAGGSPSSWVTTVPLQVALLKAQLLKDSLNTTGSLCTAAHLVPSPFS